MRSDGSNTICFRDGGGFTANARKKRDIWFKWNTYFQATLG
jgi:hypothetical protein